MMALSKHMQPQKLSGLLRVILMAGVALFFSNTATAQSVDQLLQEVREGRAAEKIANEERLAQFKADQASQASKLATARQALAEEETRGENLRTTYEENQTLLEEQQVEIFETAGAMGELQGVIRQVARDIQSVVNNSLVTAQLPDRKHALDKLINDDAMPTPDELETLWQTILEEMVESGKVASFDTKVITTNGEEVEKTITRLGNFNATADGFFLRYLPETGRLAEPHRQPPLRYQRTAKNFEEAEQGSLEQAVIDPTRGAMLSLMLQKPTLMERIKQGGVIGYIILAIGLIALIIALVRFAALWNTQRKVQSQLRDKDARDDNPLGRIMSAYTDNPDVDAETLGFKLDDAILKELPQVKRGLRTLAILAAIAPLLGLLGTVTGIIETFQSITLFGTGDPRLMSGGISKALVTTVQGLVVAIPILLLHSILSGRSNTLVQILDERSAAMIAAQAEKRRGITG